MRAPRIFLLIVALVSPAVGAPVKIVMPSSYENAINDVAIRQGVDRRVELHQCLKNWGLLGSRRAKLLDEMQDVDGHGSSGSVILEIGSSGFPRYDYIYVDGMQLKSSLGYSGNISRTALGKRIENLYRNSLADLHGAMQPEADDGDCYFLTIKQQKSAKAIAVYGSPDLTSTGLLITKMIRAATPVRKKSK